MYSELLIIINLSSFAGHTTQSDGEHDRLRNGRVDEVSLRNARCRRVEQLRYNGAALPLTNLSAAYHTKPFTQKKSILGLARNLSPASARWASVVAHAVGYPEPDATLVEEEIRDLSTR